jgi:site-specific recombinase XerD
MKLESYLRYLRWKKKLHKETCRLVGRILTRFHSFLDDESVSDLASIDAGLLERYAKTLQNLAPLTAKNQLTVIHQYLARVATRRSDRRNSREPGSQVASKVVSPARRGSSIGNQGDSLYRHFTSVLSSLPQTDHLRAFVPTFDDIRSFIEAAKNQESTLPLAHLTYVVASSGIGMGELTMLRVTDVVSDMGLVRVESKGTGGQRYVSLSPRAIQSLKSLHSRFAGSDMVFGDRSRSYLTGLYHRLHVLAVNSGIEQMRVQSLRLAALRYLHSIAKTNLEQKAVQYLAGHWNPEPGNQSELALDAILPIAASLLADLWAKLECNIA